MEKINKMTNNKCHKGNTHLNMLISKRKKLALGITTLLMVTTLGHPVTSYAKKPESTASSGDSGNSSGSSNPGSGSDNKVTLCHVPGGDPTKGNTLSVAIASLKNGHMNNHTMHSMDYLGSCDASAASPIRIVSNCPGTKRTTLNTKVQAYYQAITVNLNSALNEIDTKNALANKQAEALIIAMSECLDTDKGKGNDSVVTLNGIVYHNVFGCQESYRTNLVNADTAYDMEKVLIDPAIVPVNSLDDSAVWSDYKTCAYTNGLIDAAKSSYKQGHIDYKYHLVRCDTTAHKNLLVVDIAAYIAKPSTKDIILSETSINNDSSIKQAVDDCGSGYPLGAGDIASGNLPAKGIEGRLNWKEINSPN